MLESLHASLIESGRASSRLCHLLFGRGAVRVVARPLVRLVSLISFVLTLSLLLRRCI